MMDLLARNIAGEITLSDEPGRTMKKWREIFGIRQKELAEQISMSPSVISDYESGRRKSPGVNFIKKFTEGLISANIENGGDVVNKFMPEKEPRAILGMREFLSPVSYEDFIKKIKGAIVVDNNLENKEIWGYTVIDSIKAILEMSENDFVKLYGSTPKRALVFTKVHFGRSPVVAIKVTKPKPSMIVLHGLRPREVDKLAIKIANIEKIPLIVSRVKSEERLLENLRGLK